MKYLVLTITFFAFILTGCGTEAEDSCDLEAEQQFLVENAQNNDVIVTESGLQYKILTEVEEGDSPSSNSEVAVNYTGRTIDGDVFNDFDNVTFELDRVINGFSEGIQLMKVGETFEFYIPGNLAYGNNPPPESGFCPNATLIFEIDLIEII
ncbi:MAG: FKBP-type peptidyl-prolyl cis-trans isomerase [Balneolaceae bacterium]